LENDVNNNKITTVQKQILPISLMQSKNKITVWPRDNSSQLSHDTWRISNFYRLANIHITSRYCSFF